MNNEIKTGDQVIINDPQLLKGLCMLEPKNSRGWIGMLTVYFTCFSGNEWYYVIPNENYYSLTQGLRVVSSQLKIVRD